MPPPGASPVTVGFRCDATPTTGVGHLIRCIAFAEELVARSVAVLFLGDFDGLPWAQRQLQLRGMTVCAPARGPAALAGQCAGLGVDAVVLDGYELDQGCGEALRREGLTVLALVDGPFGAGQEADLYLDQNLDAKPLPGLPARATMLAGIEFALLRDNVRNLRRTAPTPLGSRGGQRVSVLAVFGGTDPRDAALELVPMLLDTGLPQSIRVVAARQNVAQALRELPTLPRQELEVIEPVDDLAGLATECDLVVSAAGSSVWELLCLGVPTAVVCVTANQEVGYRRVVARRIVGPLGHLDALRQDPVARASAGAVLAELLTSPSARAQQAARGLSLVDGRGRERAADALLCLVESARGRDAGGRERP
jgi:spore coat polysaccharide biosynthesis predicted glycosyltransferase SpsG